MQLPKLSVLLITLCMLQHADAQTNAGEEYRSTANTNYWKNRPPYAGYWQQDVAYTINASLDDSTDIITGTEELTYYNNSDDTLPFVYFHLYAEAFQPGSYMSELNEVNKVQTTYGKYETEGLGIEVNDFQITQINNSKMRVTTPQETIQDNTILKVVLPQALEPHASITFKIDFKTYYDNGSIRRRMKLFDAFGNKHYDGVHWYPRICVYDRKFGWETDQHLGKEFYGDFGAYEVNLTLPENYVLDATGVLQNKNEVLPAELRNKLDIKNFADKPWNSAPSVITAASGNKKTWHYKAMNVHDFAFTADPTYRIGESSVTVDGKAVQVIALVQEPHAAGWQNAADYTAKVIAINSRYIGNYIWPKIIVADARDGMEYPMLTLDGGFDPSYRNLFAHEVGHMWFFGMVGNNETYRASLDEGFTQFLTTFTYDKIDGDISIEDPESSKYKNKYRDPEHVRYTQAYYGYLADAVRQNDPPLNTHSDDFNSALGHGGGYRHVYYKTATMLYNLQYVLGDDLFLAAMHNYFEQWKLCHPYFDDFRNSVINYTHVDLNWFFDEWLETTKNIDYAIQDVDRDSTLVSSNGTSYAYDIRIKRKGEMQMPLDISVVTVNDDTLNYYIPNTWFNKYENSSENITVLPKWTGWGLLNEEYTAHIELKEKIRDVIIDTSDRLADINKLDNSWKTPLEWRYDARIANFPDWKNYEVKWRPNLRLNRVDIAKIGGIFSGNYMNYKHIFELDAWYNVGSLQNNGNIVLVEDSLIPHDADYVAVDFYYKTATDKFLPNSNFLLNARYTEGITRFKIGGEKYAGQNKRDKISLYYDAIQYRKSFYLLYDDFVQEQKNNAVHILFEHNYQYFTGNGKLKLHFRSDDVMSAYDYQYANIEEINNTRLGKFDLRTRIFGQWGSGNNIPFESALMLAGANQEDLLDNKFTKAKGAFPDTWTTFGDVTNHFQMGGGLNLRGYAGYFAPEIGTDSTLYATYRGASGASINAELAFNRLMKKPLLKFLRMTPYIFYDAGTMVYTQADNTDHFSDIRMDAGIGSTFSWTWWGPLENIKPLTVRIDLPLFLNHPPYLEEDYLKFRYVIGLERCF